MKSKQRGRTSAPSSRIGELIELPEAELPGLHFEPPRKARWADEMMDDPEHYDLVDVINAPHRHWSFDDEF